MPKNLRLTRDQLAAINARRGPNKFGARKKMVDGITFDSTHEAEVYIGLKLRQQAGEIRNLQCHVPIRVHVNEQHVFSYECDFVYEEGSYVVPGGKAAPRWRSAWADAKGYKKGAAYQLFRLKKAVIKAALGIEIEEV